MRLQFYDLAAAEVDRRFSPFCWRTRLALQHKELEYEALPLRFSEKERIAFSSQTRVPVLVHDERVISDSWKIACYLEDSFPNRPSLFGGDVGRALTRFHCEWVNMTVHPLVFRLVATAIHQQLAPEDQAYFRQSREAALGTTLEAFCAGHEKYLNDLQRTLAPVRATLQRQAYLGGEQPLYADYALFGAFMWARAVTPIELVGADTPVAAWRDRLLARLDEDSRSLRFAA